MFYIVHCLIVHPFGCPFNLLLDCVLMTTQMKVNTSRDIFPQANFPWEEVTEFYKEYFLNYRVSAALLHKLFTMNLSSFTLDLI